MFTCLVLLALFASTQGRAVNISNTWVLPEEGFPVFYRYFRDRISWYEADAVCQFHHANLVTVDTTAQYDAVRAYLKELDISSAVWVGLIRSNPDGDFTWTDYRGLSGDGYWSSGPDARAAPLCAAADPAADYRWEARACGGPTVASFICELPVPQWALGNEGCMVRAIPALTVLYLPESAAVQLTADCGLAGVKRVQCTGNVKREELLKKLSCNEEEELTSTPVITSEETTMSESVNITDFEVASESTTEENFTTKTNDVEPQSPTTHDIISPIAKENVPTKQQIKINKLNNIFSQKNINLDLIHNNNLQSNDIPKLANSNENFLTIEQTEKLEDEKHMHHKMIHDELARHGNFETIFSQPTDHFVPPLVMAKAKLSDDMTVLSLAEKHAQQLAEQRLSKHNMLNEHEMRSTSIPTTEEPHKIEIFDKPLVMTMQPINKDFIKKDKNKAGTPKKYKEKYEDPKARNLKLDGKLLKLDKFMEKPSTSFDSSDKQPDSTTFAPMKLTTDSKLQDDSVDLTVILKEPNVTKIVGSKPENKILNKEQAIPQPISTTEKPTLTTEPTLTTIETTHSNLTTSLKITKKNQTTGGVIESSTSHVQKETSNATEAAMLGLDKLQTIAMQDITLNHEIIKITIVKDGDDVNPTNTVFEVTTLMPEFKDDNKQLILDTTQHDTTTAKEVTTVSRQPPYTSTETVTLTTSTLTPETITMSTTLPEKKLTTPIVTTNAEYPSSTGSSVSNAIQINEGKIIKGNITEVLTTANIITTTKKEDEEVINITEIFEDGLDKNGTDPYAIDDTNSPLLSGANEPLHRPNRMRRPLQQSKNFNPFRILG